MWIFLWVACASKSTSEVEVTDYVWPEDAVNPMVFSGIVYCQYTDAGLQTFLEIEFDDPQGPFDVESAFWTAYSNTQETLAEDVLYCDHLNRTCNYSYTPVQYPQLPCDGLLESGHILASYLQDYSGNLSEEYQLR